MLIRALHAYVCWRIAAGAVGWAWLLLGLATDRCGATNAVALAIHVTAVSTARECIFYCSIAALDRASQATLGLGVRPARLRLRTVVFSTVSCRSGVMLSSRGTRAYVSRGLGRAAAPAVSAADPRNLARAVPLHVSCARRRVGPAERCFA